MSDSRACLSEKQSRKLLQVVPSITVIGIVALAFVSQTLKVLNPPYFTLGAKPSCPSFKEELIQYNVLLLASAMLTLAPAAGFYVDKGLNSAWKCITRRLQQPAEPSKSVALAPVVSR